MNGPTTARAIGRLRTLGTHARYSTCPRPARAGGDGVPTDSHGRAPPVSRRDEDEGDGSQPPPAVGLDGVVRTFGEIRALDGVTLKVEAGEVLGVLGHNGAGKTTMVRLLMGVLAADAGSVRIQGMDPLVDGPAVRRSTGVVSAVPAVDGRLTALQNLRFVAEVFDVERDEGERRARELLGRFGLRERAEDRVEGFSSGMRQRLALARALLPDPSLLLLDEPTSALDPVASRDVRDLIERFAREGSRSVLLCSHNLVEAQQLCDRVVILEHGQVIAEGSPATLAAELSVGRLRLEVERAHAPLAGRILDAADLPFEASDGRLLLTRPGGVDVPTLVARLVDAGVRLYAVTPEDASLEDVYLALHERERS
ncbi:MAG: ABC transporter ATP-binding protein [Nitriliruptor sp.]|nr:MAG: ABC transporter ATP-binding protein [Nitriliruptor sp.]